MSLIEYPRGDIIQNSDPLVVTADFYTASSKPRQADAALAPGGFACRAKTGRRHWGGKQRFFYKLSANPPLAGRG